MPLTYQPFSEMPEIETVAGSAPAYINVSQPERKWSLIGGAAVLAASLAGRGLNRLLGVIAGGALLYRGATGHCHLYEALGVNSQGVDDQPGVRDDEGHKVVESVVIQRPRAEIYAYWRKLENLSEVMSHVKSVEVIDSRRSHWIVSGPVGTSVSWDAEIINERPDELMAWQSLPGAMVPNAGSVWFEDAPGGATRVKVALEVEAPAGELGIKLAQIFGEAPEQQLQSDLQRFKEQMESSVSSPS